MAKNETNDFESRYNDLVAKYRVMFNEHPPSFGFDEIQLYEKLKKSIETKTKMEGIESDISETMDIDEEGFMV
tara:strand:- start:855 stop:1073 length:219 start_codon:yes stop_codon:yes gene_type:complete